MQWELVEQAEVIDGDVRDYNVVLKATKEIDVVFHLAAQAVVSHSYEYPLKTFETNALGSVNVLDIVTIVSAITGGTTDELSTAIAEHAQKLIRVEVLLHLTCTNLTKEQLRNYLNNRVTKILWCDCGQGRDYGVT